MRVEELNLKIIIDELLYYTVKKSYMAKFFKSLRKFCGKNLTKPLKFVKIDQNLTKYIC